MTDRVPPSGWRHELRMLRGCVAWHLVMRWPTAWVMHRPALWLLPWAGYYAYDDRHSAAAQAKP